MISRLVETSDHSSARAFLRALREFTWNERRSGRPWVFRGQGLVDTWRLLPSAYRPGAEKRSDYLLHSLALATSAATSGWGSWTEMDIAPSGMAPAEWDDHVSGAARLAYAHVNLVRGFVLGADRANLPVEVPEFLWRLTDPAYPGLSRFIRGEIGFSGTHDARTLGRAFALAQHHGMPTPLLDWTYSPIVAAYFAAEQALEQNEPEALAVWALSETYLDQPGTKIARHTVHADLSHYRDAQQGLFTWHPKAYLHMDGGEFRPFDEVIEEDCRDATRPGAVLRRFVLARGEANELFNLLGAERVSRASLMPGFDGVAKALELRAKWGWP